MDGEAVVSNGMSLCRLHHAAFDRLLLGGGWLRGLGRYWRLSELGFMGCVGFLGFGVGCLNPWLVVAECCGLRGLECWFC